MMMMVAMFEVTVCVTDGTGKQQSTSQRDR